MNQGIFFSIITPCYNSSRYVQETYACLTTQTYSHWEWIVVDDCSTDDSFILLQSIAKKDPRVKVFQTQSNSGAAVARNLAIEKASGQYLAFLDIDDLWSPQKLSVYFEKLSPLKIPFGYSNYLKITPTGLPGSTTIQTPESVNYKDILKTCSICTSTAVVRRDVIGSIRMRPGLRRGQDYLFWLDLLKKPITAVRLSNEALTYYRVGNNTSLSSNKLKKAAGQWRMYRDHLKLNPISAAYYFIHYAFSGYFKYRKF